MTVRRLAGVIAVGWLVVLASPAGAARAATTPVALGVADGFAVMGGTTVTSAGVSALIGDLGVSPGTAVTGFPPGTVSATIHAGDAVAAQAHADVASAYADAIGRGPVVPVTGDLGGVTLTPGVYAAGTLTLAAGGKLTLDAQGDPRAVFILETGSTLDTGAGSDVALAGGAQACNVFWPVGSSATLGASSTLAGSIVATTSISMGDGVTVHGRALARDGAVTLINDHVTAASCAGTLSNTAPAITAFSAALTGRTQTVHTAVGAWSITDAQASDAGYSVTVSATAPTVDGSRSAAGTGGSLTLTPTTATAASGNPAGTGPVASSPQELAPTASTIENASPGTGQGEWDFAADAGATRSLAVTIPGDASAGSYRSTLTYTTAPPAG